MIFGFAVYATAFIYQTSFVVNGQRHFSLFDDAMISMRYARNLANGYGLVWNPGGERVEGYTNPLWVLYMSVVHLLPVSQAKVSAVVQVTAALFLLLTLWFVYRIAYELAGGSMAVSLGAVALTAFYYPINNWALQGLEVGALVCLTTGCSWLALGSPRAQCPAPLLYSVLGIGTLVRPDMVIIYLTVTGFCWFVDPVGRQRTVIVAGLVLALCVLAQTGFRLWYFGDLLPNTYYVKMTGYPVALRMSRGAFVFFEFAAGMGLLCFALPFTWLIIERHMAAWLLAAVFAAQSLYSIFVGGDAWEELAMGANRYISIAMPGFFILLACSLYWVCELLGNARDRETAAGGRWPKWALRAAYPGLLIACLLNVNMAYNWEGLARWLLQHKPLYVTENQEMVEIAYLLRRITPRDATVAVVWAGTIPYFADRYSVDLLGKTDKHIAHLLMRRATGLQQLVAFHPGHMKYDYGYSIGLLKPDVVAQPKWMRSEGKGMLDVEYERLPFHDVYVRRGSTRVLWPEIQRPGQLRLSGELDDELRAAPLGNTPFSLLSIPSLERPLDLGDHETESPRVSWRLHSSRGWSDDKTTQLAAGDARASGADGDAEIGRIPPAKLEAIYYHQGTPALVAVSQ